MISRLSEKSVQEAHILVVDDEPTNVKLLERVLAQAGYQNVKGFTDPIAAVAYFGDNEVDLVLLDMCMPELDGFGVLDNLKSLTPPGEYLAVLVITALTDRETRLRALEAGATDFVSKPFDREEVLCRIRNMLETRLVHTRLAARLAAQLETESRLRDSEERFDLATQAADEGVWDWNIRTGEVYMSRRWKALLGYRDDELPSTLETWTGMVHPEDLSQAMVALESYMDGKLANYDKTVRLRHKDGGYRWIKNRWLAVRDEGGMAVRIVGTADDITEDVRLREELERARRHAETANRAKSQFLATMSHEIRTPMNGVLGMLSILAKTKLTEKQRYYLQTAASSGEMLLTVINDILDYSKLEAGKLELESIPFNPVHVGEEVASLLGKFAQDKDLELICNVERDVPGMVKGDPVRLRQILVNLVNNAIKFTEKGHVALCISFHEDCLRFGVMDTGIGMNDEQQGRLFKSFTQVDSSHTRKYGGTGLGLVICEHLVKAMGGRLKVASTPGMGSDFTFDLPLEVLSHHSIFDDRIDSLESQSILVVDDNETNSVVVNNFLRNWDVSRVDNACTGMTALEKVVKARESGNPFDIVLLDLQMPDMDGVEVARRIREMAAESDLKLVMLSSVDFNKDLEHVDAWITKPVRPSDLLNTLGFVINPEGIKHRREGRELEDYWFGGYRLLLVEDNPVNQEVAREIFFDVGFSVDLAENGEEALQAVQNNTYDIVFMDIQMPIMDGLEATRQIRALGGDFLGLPIIAMTAHALTGDSDISLKAGMNAHVHKPIDLKVIFETISRWLTRKERPSDGVGKGENVISDLPVLPGIDVEDGLSRMRGNWMAYQRVLTGFKSKYSGSETRFKGFLEKGEWKEAEMLAHSLKGSGGNIGAKALYQCAASLEHACREKNINLSENVLKELETSLVEIIEGLDQLQSIEQVEDSQSSLQDVDGDFHAQDAMKKILGLLDTDYCEAQSMLELLCKNVSGGEFEKGIADLSYAINSFDVDGAKNILKNMMCLQ
jgi:two-component system sensor histidine kinase/response regulator